MQLEKLISIANFKCLIYFWTDKILYLSIKDPKSSHFHETEIQVFQKYGY